MKRKSICFLTDIFIMGGVEKVILATLEHLQEYDIYLYYSFADKILEKLPSNVTAIKYDIPCGSLSRKLYNQPILSRFFYNKITEKQKFDYLIVLKPDVIPACFGSCSKNKYFWCHNDYYRKYSNVSKLTVKQRIRRAGLRWIYKRYKNIWVVSPVIRDEMSKALGLKNIKSLPNPINCTDIIAKSDEPCDISFDPEKQNIVMLGRMTEEKGFDRVIDILSDGELKHEDFHLYIIGEGMEGKKLRQLANEKGLEEKITFLGLKNNPYTYLKQADLFICPSRFESFGLVIMEAMLFGIPVITTSTTGGKYVSQSGKYCCMVENTDEALAQQIKQYVKYPETYSCSLSDAKDWVYKHDNDSFGKLFKEYLR